MIIHLLNQNHSLDTLHEQNVAENFKNEVINVFFQREIDNSSQTEILRNHTFLAPYGYFNSPEKFAFELANHYSSLKIDVDDEFSAKIDTLQVIYRSSDYLSAYSATIARKDPSALIPTLIHDPMYTYLIPHSPQKSNSTKKQVTKNFMNLPRKIETIAKTNLSTFSPHKALKY